MSRMRLVRSMVALAAIAVVLVPATGADASATATKKLTDGYRAVGTSHIGSIDADLPIARTSLLETLNLKTLRIVGGTLPIAPQTVSFTALGVIPLRATTTLIQASPITGSIAATPKGNVLKTTVAYTIKLSDVEVQFLGQWIPLDVGDNCQTIDPAVISVGSPAGSSFDIFKGGVVSGTYTIGKFANCAPLQLPDLLGVGSLPVNSLVPGSNNTVSLTLSHGHAVANP